MANLNKVTLIGRLGQDPEIRYTQSGSAVANATIATNDYWTDKQGEKQERTEWHSLVLWGKLADLAQSYLKKGSQVYVEGRLQTRDWEDQQGQKHYKTEVVVTTMQFLDSRISESESDQAGDLLHIKKVHLLLRNTHPVLDLIPLIPNKMMIT
ncbi:MAG: hypothetical protein CM1200mP28_08040 [Deltaproteobacteria bacterium]|nr:MAG: hypothetical protein CM1200mP28_08040 [Deltaproteobacteria bacterium]